MAVERGVDRHPEGLTYAIAEDGPDVAPGDRVIVGLGRGGTPTPGWVIGVSATTDVPASKLKPIRSVDTSVPRLPGELLALARWTSDYYAAPIGVTIAAMVPSAVKKRVGSRRRVLVDLPEAVPSEPDAPDAGPADTVAATATATATATDDNPSSGPSPGNLPANAAGTAPGNSATNAFSSPPRTPSDTKPTRPTPKQRRIIEVLAAAAEADRPMALETLMERAELKTRGPIERLAERGELILRRIDTVEAAWRRTRVDARVPARLSDEQLEVLRAVVPTLDPAAGFAVHLLHGVTGSGKTEVYIRLIEQVVAAGGVALVLVPEISLTPQTTARLLGRFPGERVAVLHSGLTAAQRHQQWIAAANGEASIVLGARSAVFAPIPDGRLGLVVVDEEHDSSFKQDRAPRYHGRDVAIRRAQLAGCPVLLGSATPSMESWVNATRLGRATLHRMRHRAPGMQLPRVRVVDFAGERRSRPSRDIRLIGPTLQSALRHTLDAGGQAILLLNRRGYASWITCPDARCGWVMTCTECDVSVVYHRDRTLPTGGYVRCHHCDAEQRMPPTCPDCRRKLIRFGLGTQRVEEELAREFPDLVAGDSLLRVDSDTMRHAGELHAALERFGDGHVRVLTGTQMIAKGLDFPNVRLVGVVNADTAINLPDFRAAERTFQLVSQVAGRGGRSPDPALSGTVIVQSFNPETPAIRLAARHDFDAFAAGELEDRRRAELPPWSRMTRIVLRHADAAIAAQRAETAAADVREAIDAAVPGPHRIRIDGPMPCGIARIAGRFRHEFILTAPDAGLMQAALAAARSAGALRPGADMAVDVDPASML
ncbi:MAG: primosomal protein N' [Phycisphaerales bacterium]